MQQKSKPESRKTKNIYMIRHKLSQKKDDSKKCKRVQEWSERSKLQVVKLIPEMQQKRVGKDLKFRNEWN